LPYHGCWQAGVGGSAKIRFLPTSPDAEWLKSMLAVRRWL
jgi:hypothetical protein